jgi:tetratricopeptide (TPR) repeat protein
LTEDEAKMKPMVRTQSIQFTVVVAALAWGCSGAPQAGGAPAASSLESVGAARHVRVPTPEELERGRLRGQRHIADRARVEAAFAAGDLAEAERVYKGEFAYDFHRDLQLLYVDQGRWGDLVALGHKKVIFGGRMRTHETDDPPLAIAYYRLGDAANGDRYCPLEVADCGAWYTYDHVTHETDEGPNKTPLDSPRKREAASWHALADEVYGSAGELRDYQRALEYSEKAARMFPDVPAFSYLYAHTLKDMGYTTGAIEEFERTARNGRGYFAVRMTREPLRILRHFAGDADDRGRRP